MSRLLTDLRPDVRPLVDKFLDSCAAAELDILVTCTLRTLAEQAALYAQGRTAPGAIVTNAEPGSSAHNYGLAIDVVPIVNGKPDWSGTSAVWQQVGALGIAAGLDWAGSPGFPFHEFAHLQLHNWRNVVGL
jgi:peptidoglycan LD-endopeptidase CwlK